MATNDALREAFTAALPDASFGEEFGELTLFVEPDRLIAALRACKDDPALSCELLADVSGIHWPAGDHVIDRQVSTSGWPAYRVSRDEGVIEVLYMLRSLTLGHTVRIAVRVDDEAPALPTSMAVYPQAANWHEREVFDMFGVDFVGHPDLERILMPEDWIGHPHRKDYPLGGIEIPYKNDKSIAPPQDRDLREVAPQTRHVVEPAIDQPATDDGGAL